MWEALIEQGRAPHITLCLRCAQVCDAAQGGRPALGPLPAQERAAGAGVDARGGCRHSSGDHPPLLITTACNAPVKLAHAVGCCELPAWVWDAVARCFIRIVGKVQRTQVEHVLNTGMLWLLFHCRGQRLYAGPRCAQFMCLFLGECSCDPHGQLHVQVGCNLRHCACVEDCSCESHG